MLVVVSIRLISPERPSLARLRAPGEELQVSTFRVQALYDLVVLIALLAMSPPLERLDGRHFLHRP